VNRLPWIYRRARAPLANGNVARVWERCCDLLIAIAVVFVVLQVAIAGALGRFNVR
jgi:hypothetical protein